MGRNKNVGLRNYFDDIDNNSVCKICNTQIKGMHAGNLKRHLQLVHKEVYNDLQLRQNQNTTINKKTKVEIKITISPDDVKMACIEMVTKGGVAISTLNCSGFRKIVSPLYAAFPDSNIKPNSHNITMELEILSNKIKEDIKISTKNKMLSLKIDSASRLGRNFFAINIQYICNAKIVINTIGMMQMYDRQTAENLRDKILEVLLELQLKVRDTVETNLFNYFRQWSKYAEGNKIIIGKS